MPSAQSSSHSPISGGFTVTTTTASTRQTARMDIITT